MLSVLLRYCAAALILTLPDALYASQQELYDVSNRMGREIPVVVTQLVLKHATHVAAGHSRADGADIRITRCTDDTPVPFYLEASSLNTDSLICWVRISSLPPAGTVSLVVDFNTSRSTSLSNGSAVFDLFDDFSSATASSSRWVLPSGSSITNGVLRPAPGKAADGSMVLWKGATTLQDRNAIIETRLRAPSSGGGTFAFFVADPDGRQAYVLEHDVAAGSTTPDLFRIDADAASPLTNSSYVWNANEYVRCQIVLRGDSMLISRASEQRPDRVHVLRQIIPDVSWSWYTLGYSTFANAPGSFEVDWICVRPRLDVEPIVKRRTTDVVVAPGHGVICDGSPVTLNAPNGWSAYRWSNGSTAKQITVTSPTTLSLTLSDGRGCIMQQGPFRITSGTAPNAGRDTLVNLCFGRRVILSANPGYAAYRWFIGTGQLQTKIAEGSNQIEIDSADIYHCLISNTAGCTDTVIYRVNRVFDSTAVITTSVGSNQMCIGDTVILFAQPPLSYYQWYKDDILLSETSDRLHVVSPGTYRLRVRIGDSINACISTAVIEMVQRNRSALNLPSAIELCEGDTAVLDAGDAFTTYEWSNGQRGQSINVFTSGKYELTASFNGACADSAIVMVTVKPAPLVPIRSVDGRASMCIGERLDLEIDSTSWPILWSTGDTTRRVTITNPGTYSATITYPNGCKRTSTIRIDNGVMEPVIVALDNQALCVGDSTRLTTTLPYDSYVWSTGETSDTIVVSAVGTYSVEVMLFECRSSSFIIIDEASPLGPTIAYDDTLSICEARPAFPLHITNTQAVPRIYKIGITGSGFSVPSPQHVIPALSTLPIPILYDGSQGRGLHTAVIEVSDLCGWSAQYNITIDYGTKNLPLVLSAATPDGSPIQAGNRMSLSLQISDASDVVTKRPQDTIRCSLNYDPLQLHIPIDTVRAPYGVITVHDRAGRIDAVLTPLNEEDPRELIALSAEVLTSSSLQGRIIIDSISINNPCMQLPISNTISEFTIKPYGCEIDSIGWSEVPRLSVIRGTYEGFRVRIEAYDTPCILQVIDVLGRVHTAIEIPPHDAAVEMPLASYGAWQHFIVMTSTRGHAVEQFVPGNQ